MQLPQLDHYNKDKLSRSVVAFSGELKRNLEYSKLSTQRKQPYAPVPCLMLRRKLSKNYQSLAVFIATIFPKYSYNPVICT